MLMLLRYYSLVESLRDHFENKGAKYDMKFEEMSPSTKLSDALTEGEQYCYVELPDGVKLLYRKPEESRHPVEFGREVISDVLRMPQRRSWKFCAVSVEEETIQNNGFKADFKEFASGIEDFNMF